MIRRKIVVVFLLTLFLGAGQAILNFTAHGEPGKNSGAAVTEILHIMGKGSDYIVVAEEPLYIVPHITKITDRYGKTISLNRLRTPCLAEVTYAHWLKGVDKLPVVVYLKVKKVKLGASSTESRE